MINFEILKKCTITANVLRISNHCVFGFHSLYPPRNFSPYQLRSNDVYHFRVTATTNELHPPCRSIAAHFAEREDSGKSTRSRRQSFSHRSRSRQRNSRVRYARMERNPDSDRLRLKGSLASSFAMYRSPRDRSYYHHNFAIIRLDNSRFGRSVFPSTAVPLMIPFSLSLSPSFFSFSFIKLHVKRSGL